MNIPVPINVRYFSERKETVLYFSHIKMIHGLQMLDVTGGGGVPPVRYGAPPFPTPAHVSHLLCECWYEDNRNPFLVCLMILFEFRM
jgi:hypothetical protein